MKLYDLIDGIKGWTILQGSAEAAISDFAESAALAKHGSIFFCVRGIEKDGHDFIQEAVKNGASAIVVERYVKVKQGVTVIKVKDAKEAMFYMTDKFFAGYKEKVKIIAITGTKGKTTVSYLISAMLKQKFKKENAVIGTIGYRIGKKSYPAGNTTPSNIRIHKLIAEAARAGIKWVILEASSQALDQGRLRNIIFDTAVVTNVTRDHFDYHRNFRNYLKAKMIITENLKRGGRFVMNLDSKGKKELLAAAKKRTNNIVTYSFERRADIVPGKYSLDIKGTDFILNIKGRNVEFNSGLVGRHNIYNVMSAVGAVTGAVDEASLAIAVNKFKTVEGRMDKAYSGEFDVIVDYAHTPDSMEKILQALAALKKGRIITVFGAGGNKDRGKRPMMGAIAERLSDEVIVTSDNPRFEEPERIIQDILAGIKNRKRIFVEPDRRKAIEFAIKTAGKDDIVLLAGKGHERYQEIKGIKYGFEDKKTALEIIKKLKSKKKIFLPALLKGLAYRAISGSMDVEIKGVEDRSSKVKKGFLFIAVKGFVHDGHDFIGEAVRRGAAAVIVHKPVRLKNKRTVLIKVKDTREALFKVVDNFYSDIKGKIKIIGITGTNGKTTVLYMIDEILKAEYGRPNAIVGTIEYRIGRDKYRSLNTTPSNIVLHRLIAEAVEKKMRYFIMEVSSHALDQGRVSNIELDTAVLTNVTRDHFDYHGNFSNYLAAKQKIVDAMRPGGRLVVNIDDRNSGKFIKAAKKRGLKVLTYSLKKKSAAIFADSYELDLYGSSATLNIKGVKEKIRANMPGIHNIYNMMSAAGACLNDARIKSIRKGIENLKTVNGRTQIVYDGPFKVMVDYAHTPDALEKVLSTVNAVKEGKVITVFGAPGNRDRGKRPMMGAVVEKLSDEMVVTSDNAENEEPMDIINNILAGIKNRAGIKAEPDRRKAIRAAINMAVPGDIVLIAGKGHETYQDIGGKRIPFEDKKVALSILGGKK
jgi:UDP-N-acetylmuramoyl-L-alanyl-D-glutamate--2,6-diaminopimelate ligase